MNPEPTLQRTIQLLTTTLNHLDDTIEQLQLNRNGYPTNTTGQGSTPTLNPAGNPTGLDRYLNQPDPATQDHTTLIQAIQTTHHHALELHRITTQWTTPTPHKELTRGTDCLACTRYVPNTDTDRIRAGLCQSCHRSWIRSHRERGEWLIERKRKLQHTPGGDTTNTTQPIQDTGTAAIATD
jgi:hypothetical protein